MSTSKHRIALTALLFLLGTIGWYMLAHSHYDLAGAAPVNRCARISPDYSDVTIPPNIAPLNFTIQDAGERFAVRVSGELGDTIEVFSRTPEIIFPLESWRALLAANRGQSIRFTIHARVNGVWQQYKDLVQHVAQEDIDSHLAYRMTGLIHYNWGQISINQRDLTTYESSPIFDNADFDNGCVNCHSFAGNNPQRMIVSTRSADYGSAALVVADGQAEKIDTKFGYTAWHPQAQLAVYSVNKVRQFFHTTGEQVRDVIDLDAALAYYSLETKNVKMVPCASDKNRLESYPNWSPDGRFLYYCSAPFLWTNRDSELPAKYAEVRYDLMRIPYDIETDEWGEPETVLSADETGLSILEPRISPDGRFLLCCMCDYGCFPTYRPSSDLYMIDLATGDYRALKQVNSEQSESWHSWSSNSRWIAFSSKRRDGVFTRCYLSYIDETGRAGKPLIVPQEDPTYYDSLLMAISVPNLLTGPVTIESEELAELAKSSQVVEVDAITGATQTAGTPYDVRSAGH